MERNDFVESRIDIIKNIYTLYSYIHGESESDREWALERMKKGKWYVVEPFGNKLLFAPSRFVGYKKNNRTKHSEEEVNGISTNKAISNIQENNIRIYHEVKDDKRLSELFSEFMNELGMETNNPKFFIPYDLDISNPDTHKCYFVSPTHCQGQKDEAWKSFLTQNIMAIGWNDRDYTTYSIDEIEKDHHNYDENERRKAVSDFTLLKQIKSGDIICCTNNKFGLWGIGIAVSSYKYKQHIHHAGIDDNNNESYYSHYIDVAWLCYKENGFIPTAELNIKYPEKQWQPYGTLSQKEIPQYIYNYILKNGQDTMEDTNKYNEYTELLKANKNLILTGAPGTGKTFLAKEIAKAMIYEAFTQLINTILSEGLTINSSKNKTKYHIDRIDDSKVYISGDTISNYGIPFKEIEKAYNNRLWEGGQKNGYDSYSSALAKYIHEMTEDIIKTRVQFVQFHPSYDYTDFVEGLRPTAPDEKGNIGFERKDGIFKEFCKRAIKSGVTDTIDNFEECWNKLIDALNESNYIDIPLISGKSTFRLELNVSGDGLANRTYENDEYTKDSWIHGMSKFFSKEQMYNVYKGFPGIPSGGHDNYRKAIINYMYKKLGLKRYFKGTETSDRKNTPFIFIIDEINRGELSKIFGELFFSIDPGYRGNEIRVKTQYQNMITDKSDPFYEGFYVPENVYIIGTMNDIDRSVESMDFAMRRRFAWKEIKASDNTGMLDDLGELKDEVLAKMELLNNTIWDESKDSGIEGLSTAYHIGGAYFKHLESYLKNSNNKEEAYRKLWDNHLKGVLFEYLRGSLDAKKELKKLENVFFQNNTQA